MADINDLYDDEEFEESSVEETVNNNEPPVNSATIDGLDDDDDDDNDNNDGGSSNNIPGDEDDEDLISTLLARQGISDRTKIKFEDEDGTIQELDWDSLTREEQANILSTQPTVNDDNDLDDAEIDFLNRLRLSNMTPADYIKLVQQQAVNQYASQIQQAQEPVYTVDGLSDEELFILDLQARVPDITDEELEDSLEKAKENEDLFTKQVAGIRDEYKQLEDQKKERDNAIEQQRYQEQYNAFSSAVADQIENLTNIGELDINMDDNDMDELYTFITGQDQAGVNHLAKAINDPETLVKMAWFALRGEDVLNSISNYYKNEIKRAHRAGFEQGKSSVKPAKESKVVVSKKSEKNNINKNKNNKNVISIDDLDDD